MFYELEFLRDLALYFASFVLEQQKTGFCNNNNLNTWNRKCNIYTEITIMRLLSIIVNKMKFLFTQEVKHLEEALYNIFAAVDLPTAAHQQFRRWKTQRNTGAVHYLTLEVYPIKASQEFSCLKRDKSNFYQMIFRSGFSCKIQIGIYKTIKICVFTLRWKQRHRTLTL